MLTDKNRGDDIMKKAASVFILLFIFGIYLSSDSHAGIANTVHNMSISGAGTIKATTETEICVFCHIPHNSQPGRPLWNHDMTGAAYTMYNSDYLTRASYTVPTALGTPTAPGQIAAGTISRQCLSCHDGTVAVGAIYMVRGTIMGATNIIMSDVTAGGAIKPTATGFIGGPAGELGNLTRHHPVGIQYDSTINIAFGVGSRSIELVTNYPSSSAIKLYTIGASRYVECSSCHDPHIQQSKFLRDPAGPNLAAKISNTCSACHAKISWTGSIHQTNASAYTDAAVNTYFGANTITTLVCMNCHRTHKGLGAPYLLRQAEETTCFMGAASATNLAPCHGSGGAKNIQTILPGTSPDPNLSPPDPGGRTYGHPTKTISGKHTNLDVLYPTAAGKGLQWSDSRHAECVDCHNQHRATQGTHNVPSDATGWYPQSPTSTTNNVSNALTGVPGVEPGSATIWTVPTTFTTYESATKEYQICFKCHSYWALRNATSVTSYTTASGATVTDQATEFNPNNKSAHPVRNTLNSQAGSYIPQALTTSQMSSPWNTNYGNQTMYCSDCHGTDNEAAGDPKGPHGSSYKYMLKGTGKYWPTKSDGSTLWTLNTTDASNTALFCKNCHPIYDGSWKNSAHSGMAWYGAKCVNCHVAVPHGSKRSRLIGYSSDISPYNYNGNSLKITGFKKTSGTYAQSNCSTNCGGHGGISGADP